MGSHRLHNYLSFPLVEWILSLIGELLITTNVCDTTESLRLLINEKGEVRGIVKREEREGRNAMDLSG